MKYISTLIFALLAFNAQAEVEMTTQVFKVVEKTDANGSIKQEWQAPQNMVPGTVVGYRIEIKNSGKEAAKDLIINNPIPANTTYIADSARGADASIDYSVDSGKTFAQPAQLLVIKNGKKVQASAADYTHIRWTFNKALAPKNSTTAQYTVKLN